LIIVPIICKNIKKIKRIKIKLFLTNSKLLNFLIVINIKVAKIIKGNVDLKNIIFSYKLFFIKLLLRKFSVADDDVKIVITEKIVNIYNIKFFRILVISILIFKLLF
jgi:hypothetical protein